MSVVTLRMPEDKHARLRMIAKSRGVSINRLLDEVATVALAQHDAEVSFRARASRGRGKRTRALELLQRLDRNYARRKTRTQS